MTPVTGEDGSTRYIVNIPGTEEWGLDRGSNPFDLVTNVQLLGHEESRAQDAVLRAMNAAGVPDGAEVMLVGHSQGGILAASIAQDAHQPFTVRSIVTAGSPIARFDIPPDVSQLSLEHTQDVVPLAEAQHTAGSPGHQTIRTPMDRGLVLDGQNPIGAAHATENYAATAGRLHDEGQLDSFEARNRDFFVTHDSSGGYSTTGETIQVPVGERQR